MSAGAAGAGAVSGLRVRQVERENRGDQTGGNADAEDGYSCELHDARTLSNLSGNFARQSCTYG